MTQFGEIYGCDSQDTINFFIEKLRDITLKDVRLLSAERIYIASVLAHYASVSRESRSHLPPCVNLSGIYDIFFMELLVGTSERPLLPTDTETAEVAGNQTLLLTGFFQGQMKRRYNIRVFQRYGQTFYSLAAEKSVSQKRRELLSWMATNFPIWSEVLYQLSNSLRDNPYLIKLPDSPPAA